MASPFKTVTWDATPKPRIHSSIRGGCRTHQNSSENALELSPLDFVQMYQSQNQSTTCSPSTLGEASQNHIFRSASLGDGKQSIHPLALDTVNDFCDFFDQASMTRSAEIAQALDPMTITPTLDALSPTYMPEVWEHQFVKPSDSANMINSVRGCQVQRRREQNRVAQRAFRARKEKYTRDLENDYGHLVGRYNELVQLLRDVNVDQSGAIAPQELSREEQQEREGEIVEEKCRSYSL